jgi:hypothetical protein
VGPLPASPSSLAISLARQTELWYVCLPQLREALIQTTRTDHHALVCSCVVHRDLPDLSEGYGGRRPHTQASLSPRRRFLRGEAIVATARQGNRRPIQGGLARLAASEQQGRRFLAFGDGVVGSIGASSIGSKHAAALSTRQPECIRD